MTLLRLKFGILGDMMARLSREQRKAKRDKNRRRKQQKMQALLEAFPEGLQCPVCKLTKPLDKYYNPNNRSGGQKCKTCSRKDRKKGLPKKSSGKHWYVDLPIEERRKYARKRHQQIKLATPSWYDHGTVKALREEAGEKGLVVDHIVPLQSPRVCGLHVQNNMQLLTRKANFHKSNKVWEGM